jgi:hypothetical protein
VTWKTSEQLAKANQMVGEKLWSVPLVSLWSFHFSAGRSRGAVLDLLYHKKTPGQCVLL